MAQTVVIIIRVLLGLALGYFGLAAIGIGLAAPANREFPTQGLILGMFIGVVGGSASLFGAWRLLSTTLRMPPQSTN